MKLIRQKLLEEVEAALQSQPFHKVTDLDLATVTHIAAELRCCALYQEATGDTTFALVLDRATAPVGRKWPSISVLKGNGVRFLDLRTPEEMKESLTKIGSKVSTKDAACSMPKEDEIEEALGAFMQGRVKNKTRRAKY